MPLCQKYFIPELLSYYCVYLQVDILCNDELLGKDHTLKFIFVTRWRSKVNKELAAIDNKFC